METSFWISIRLFDDHIRLYAKDLANHLERNVLHRKRLIRHVPHITILPKIRTDDIKAVIRLIEAVVEKYDDFSIKVDGFDHFPHLDEDDKEVVFMHLKRCVELERLRDDLLHVLASKSTRVHIPSDEFKPHITLSMNLNRPSFNRAWKFVCELPRPRMDINVPRISLLNTRDSTIIREYDLLLKRSLNRREALDRNLLAKTRQALNKEFGLPPQDDSGLLRKLNLKKGTYIISDTHFDHENIIKYCHRPFLTVEAMNRTLFHTWNRTVHPHDSVFFLGDLLFGRNARSPEWWIRRLNGNVTLIRGSHDNIRYWPRDIIIHQQYKLNYHDREFLLVHDPADAPSGWHGWIIHGHVHNNKMDEYPFINGERKTINVSVEVIGYRPLNFDYLLKLDLDRIKRMRTFNSRPERW